MDKEFVIWFKDQWTNGKLPELFDEILHMQKNAATSALQQGDTEFEKGKVQALEEVMLIPKRIGDTLDGTSKDDTESETP